MIENTEELQGQMIASGQVVASMIATKGAKGEKGDPGEQGIPGTDGTDGLSPIITTEKQGKVTTLTIVDAEGTKTATILDGNDGSGTGDMLKATYDTNDNGIVDNAEKVNNHTVLSDVPSDAVFTDTTYTAGTGIEITAGNVINNTQSGGGLEELPIEWDEEEGLVDLCSLNNGVYIVPEDEEFETLTASIQRVRTYMSRYDLYIYDYDEIKPNDVIFVNLVNYGSNPVTPSEGDSFSIIRGYNIKSLYISEITTASGVTTYTWDDTNPVKSIKDTTLASPSNLFTNDVNILNADYTLNYTDATSQVSKSINLPKGSMVLGKVDDLITQKRNEVILVSSDGKLYKMTYCEVGSNPDATIVEIIPTKTSQLTNDSNFISTSSTTGLIKNDGTIDTTSYSTFSGSYTDLSNKPTIPSKVSDLTNDSGFITGLVELSYGSSTWNDFITAYNAKKIVYCRASSGSNPGSGSQTRKAFMAYVNNVDSPTSVEFQYVRSIATHTDSQQGDQVFVYTLTNASGGTWSVTTREMSTKIVAGTNMTSSYSSGVLTLNAEAESIPVQDTAPTNPSAGDLWVDTSESQVEAANILNSYSTSTTDTYSCDYENKYFGGVVLYINNSGSSEEITLNDNITNYEIIKVFYFNGNIANSVEFKPLSGTTNFTLESSYKSGSSLIHTISRYACTNANKMTPVTDECGYWGLSGSTIAMHYDSTNYSKIYKVIGYK